MDDAEQRERILAPLALESRGHERGRSDRDRASRALEGDVIDAIVEELHVERDLVATERVHALDGARRVGEPAEVLRMATVVDDHILVELAEVVAHVANRSVTSAPTRARSGAFAMRSTISRANAYVRMRARRLLGQSTRAQVEQGILVQMAHRCTVGALDVVGEDFQARPGIDLAVVREEQVLVGLAGICAEGRPVERQCGR